MSVKEVQSSSRFARKVARRICAKQKPDREGGLGIEIPNTKISGVQLDEITPNRSADLAGIKQGDIVIQFGDTPIRTPEEFLSRVRRAIPYSTVNVEIIRANEHIVIPVKIGKS